MTTPGDDDFLRRLSALFTVERAATIHAELVDWFTRYEVELMEDRIKELRRAYSGSKDAVEIAGGDINAMAISHAMADGVLVALATYLASHERPTATTES